MGITRIQQKDASSDAVIVNCDVSDKGLFLPRKSNRMSCTKEGIEFICADFNEKLTQAFKSIERECFSFKNITFIEGDFEVIGCEVYFRGLILELLPVDIHITEVSEKYGTIEDISKDPRWASFELVKKEGDILRKTLEELKRRLKGIQEVVREDVMSYIEDVIEGLNMSWQGDDVENIGKQCNIFRQLYESGIFQRHFFQIYELFQNEFEIQRLPLTLGTKSQKVSILLKGQPLNWRSFIVMCCRGFFPHKTSLERQDMILESLNLIRLWVEQGQCPSPQQVKRIEEEIGVQRFLKLNIKKYWKVLFENFQFGHLFKSKVLEEKVQFLGKEISAKLYLDQVYAMMFGKKCSHEFGDRMEIAFYGLQIAYREQISLDEARRKYMKERVQKYRKEQKEKTAKKVEERKRGIYEKSPESVIRNNIMEIYVLFEERFLRNGGEVNTAYKNRKVSITFGSESITWRTFLLFAGKEFFKSSEDYQRQGLVLKVLKVWQRFKKKPSSQSVLEIKVRYEEELGGSKLLLVNDIQDNFEEIYSLFIAQFQNEGRKMSTGNAARAVRISFLNKEVSWDKFIEAMGEELFPEIKVSERRNKKKDIVIYMEKKWQEEQKAMPRAAE